MSDAAAELARIRRAVIDTYGEDYGGEDVAAEVERLLGHLSEFETNMGRLLGTKSEAIERENRAAGMAIAKYSIAKERAERAEAVIERVRRMAQVWVDIRPVHPTATREGHAVAYAGQQILAVLDAREETSVADLTEEQEIELEMERQDAGVEQDLHDRVADVLDGAEKGAELEAIWAVIEPALATSELGHLRAKLADEAQTMREIESTCNRLLTSAVELKATTERVERLRDKWLAWPKDDMHYAAGLMLDRHLSGEAFSLDTRPVSVESPGNDGFRFERAVDLPPGVTAVTLIAERAAHAGTGEVEPRARAEDVIDDALWRMHQLRSWAYRETTGDVQHNVLAVITNVWDCLDPERKRGPGMDAPATPGGES